MHEPPSYPCILVFVRSSNPNSCSGKCFGVSVNELTRTVLITVVSMSRWNRLTYVVPFFCDVFFPRALSPRAPFPATECAACVLIIGRGRTDSRKLAHVDDLIWPLFVFDGAGNPADRSLLGSNDWESRETIDAARRGVDLGIRRSRCFPLTSRLDKTERQAREAVNGDNLILPRGRVKASRRRRRYRSRDPRRSPLTPTGATGRRDVVQQRRWSMTKPVEMLSGKASCRPMPV